MEQMVTGILLGLWLGLVVGGVVGFLWGTVPLRRALDDTQQLLAARHRRGAAGQVGLAGAARDKTRNGGVQ